MKSWLQPFRRKPTDQQPALTSRSPQPSSESASNPWFPTESTASGANLPARSEVIADVQRVNIGQNPQRPFISLFLSRPVADQRARELGAPWVPVAYACGYVLTDGWHFRDADGLLPTFCPVPPACLESLRDLVIRVQRDRVPPKDLPGVVGETLRSLAVIADLPAPRIEAIGLCVIMRVGYPSPVGAKDDWLTMPAWALKLPRRKLRLG